METHHYFEMLPLRIRMKSGETTSGASIRLLARNRIKKPAGLKFILDGDIRSVTDFPSDKLKRLSAISGIAHDRLLLGTFHHMAINFGRSPYPQSLGRFLSRAVANTLRYCPKCLAEDPYYRIHWRFIHIPVCQHHNCLLLERCNQCGNTIPLFSLPPNMAVCPHCGAHLWKFESEIPNMDFQKVDQEYQALEILLHPVANWDFYGFKNFTGFIGHLGREYRLARHIRLDSMTEKTGLSKKYVGILETGDANRRYLGFRVYQIYLNALGLSMYDILTRGSTPYESLPLEKVAWRNRPTRFGGQTPEEYYERRVKGAIDELTKSDTLLSAAAIARVSGVSPSVIYDYPNLRRLLPRYAKAERALSTPFPGCYPTGSGCLESTFFRWQNSNQFGNYSDPRIL